jgi:hypothetical protein
MFRCSDVQMFRCADGQMGRCADVQMLTYIWKYFYYQKKKIKANIFSLRVKKELCIWYI